VARNILVLVLIAAVTACAGDPVNDNLKVPPIVEVFACSDYCPGLPRNYIKRVYEGITDEDACRELGGEPYTYMGWGMHTVCEVK
jgi:hypothetical protein